MKKKFINYISLLLGVVLLAPSLAFAQAGVDVNATVAAPAVSVKITAATELQRTRADKEIDRRNVALTAMIARITDLKRLNADAKASVSSSLSAQVSALTNLKAKIAADTDEATLKTDIKAVTDSYRIFVLVLPQGRIIIMSDTVVYIADAYLQLGAKLNARIGEAKAAGNNTAAVEASLTNLATKSNDAKTQAQASVDIIAALAPDGGDKAKMAANTKALLDARAKLKVSMDDLKAARAEAVKIMVALKTFKVSASGSASTTVAQ